MAKNRILTVGCSFPGDEFEYVDFDSDATLLDADIVLFEPSLGHTSSYQSYNGKVRLDDHTSFSAKRRVDHWRSEIIAATKAGKLVIVYLVKPVECYRSTGERTYSGTGRSRVTTNIVTEITSYESVPGIGHVIPKSGTEVQLIRDAKIFAPYWSEFSAMSPYEVELEGDFKRTLLKSKSGDRTVGAIVGSTGALFLVPPIAFPANFTKSKDNTEYWTPAAFQFGKRLVAILGALRQSLKSGGEATPQPNWVADSQFRLEEERLVELRISDISKTIAHLQSERTTYEEQLERAGVLRNLLFEQGKLLELAVLEALRLVGFRAEPFADGESEFDAVFVSPEGRFLGEVEGKDNKAVNIDKMSQLERNIQEDFARDEVTEHAKGVLFGNAFRLSALQDREEFFTDKTKSAAKRVGAALVRTPDLFLAAKYAKEHPEDTDFARDCRRAIFTAAGEVVAFPVAPLEESRAQPTTMAEPSSIKGE